MNLNQIKKVHFIGIGGIGMSALARALMHDKKEVSGSDRILSNITESLRKEGVKIFHSQKGDNISSETELFVYTEAMQSDHEEMVAARAQGAPMMNYFEALGLIANEYYLIAVSGTHGKTTTTAMITDILEAAEYDPTAIIGSLRSKTGSNYRAGKSKYAVVEACEYRRDFLSLKPDVLVITNIEAEHLDYYKDLKDVQNAFHELAEQVNENGAIVCNIADKNVMDALKEIEREIIDYGKYVDLLINLKQPGMHNRMNAAAAKATSTFVGVKDAIIKDALQDFAGTWRRFEYKGEVNGAQVYDDYGHHPTEIRATLQGVRELYPDKEIVLIYQPHLDSRTEKLFNDFVDALGGADKIILAPIYAARQENNSEVSSEKLAKKISKSGGNAEYYATFDEIVRRVGDIASNRNIILVMGAGDINEVAKQLIK